MPEAGAGEMRDGGEKVQTNTTKNKQTKVTNKKNVKKYKQKKQKTYIAQVVRNV